MRRTLVKLLLFSVIGAILCEIAAVALWTRSVEWTDLHAQPAPMWLLRTFDQPDLARGFGASKLGVLSVGYRAPNTRGGDDYAHIVEAGWPMRAFRAWGTDSSSPGRLYLHGPDPTEGTVDAFDWPVFTRPMPAGFMLDSAFYGTLAFGLYSAPGFIKRVFRQRCTKSDECDLRT